MNDNDNPLAASPGPAPHARPRGEQAEMPFAVVQGEPITTLPRDLYIPPDALEVFLDAFEGPLDLLLYLIKRQNLDILDIPILAITRQYMEYVDMMKDLRLELAAEYLVMAVMLAQIKSRMLLPSPQEEDGEESDPSAELVRRLQEYERYKQAAENLNALPQVGRDVFPVEIASLGERVIKAPPAASLQDLVMVFKELLERARLYGHHHIRPDSLSVRERMSQILSRLQEQCFTRFDSLFDVTEGRAGLVVSFLALLELVRSALVELVQNEPFEPIHVKLTNS